MVIPLVDIIFFLLAFFIMSTLYMVEQNIIPVNLPATSTAQTDQTKQFPITVTADGNIYLEQEEIPLPLLPRRIEVELASNPDTVFVLRADKSLEYGRVIEILDVLKNNGVRRVSVATEVNPS